MDAATSIGKAQAMPKPGDLSVCFGCGEVLQFDQHLRQHQLTARELVRLDPDEAALLRRLQSTVRLFRSRADGNA
jgi:hypothetical protein